MFGEVLSKWECFKIIMYIIGISSGLKHGHHDGVILLKNGKVLYAAEEEIYFIKACQIRTTN